MKKNVRLAKRFTAMVLTLCMMLSSMAGYIPGWFTAFAEDSVEESVSVPDEGSSGASESSGSSESSGGSESSGSSETSGGSETSSVSESSSGSETSSVSESSGSSETSGGSESGAESEVPVVVWSGSSDEAEASVAVPVEPSADEGTHRDEAVRSEDNQDTSDVMVWGGEIKDTSDGTVAEPSGQTEEVEQPEDAGAAADVETTDAPAEGEQAEGTSNDQESQESEEVAEETQAQPAEQPVAEEGTEAQPAEEPVAEEGAEAQPAEEPVAEENTEVQPAEQPVAEENIIEETETTEGDASSDLAVDAEQPLTTSVTAALETPKVNAVEEGSHPTDETVYTVSESFETPIYSVPVAVAGDGKTENKVCVLQQKINDAMSAATGTLTGKLRVVLEKGTAYEGEVKIEKGDREVKEDFELEIAAEDAGDDGLQADGTTTFTGTMSIQGINVAIRGVGLPGKVSVSTAKLAYTGSVADDTVNVEAKDAAVDIQTGNGNDAVTLNAETAGRPSPPARATTAWPPPSKAALPPRLRPAKATTP